MKSLKLKSLGVGINDMLSREQMKKVLGGCGTGCGNGCNTQYNSVTCRDASGHVLGSIAEDSHCGSGWFGRCSIYPGSSQSTSTCNCS
ncbi:hypothetical protein [Mucilaginibacter sp.]|uniref:hypothetical protein n=1 Tax=Mucilaginibacter sp. TaxID=1882438 RepID=UPI0025D3505E|nr:hypothetical protein [Mucilaginibacter sp.]